MASSKDLSVEGSVTGYSDEDFRGDGRKKKFKPLSAMKKFFTKKRDKKDSVVAVKATSTTVLHSGYRTDEDEDDDDGGFRSHPRPLALAGNRSLSEDSVFSPEPRTPSIAVFPKSAVSDESIPKSAFQSELLSKLNKRRPLYSDDDHDDGLPRSPVPPVTTADVMYAPLKKLPGPSGKSSNNRDSDQSLISVDTSENEEDLFLSKWKNSVPAKKTSSTSSTTASNTMDTLDLNSIQKTELLVSTAAKDKIMVKPKRKGAKQARKNRDTSPPVASLPSLNEESPTRTKPEDIKDSWISGSPTAKSAEKPILSDVSQAALYADKTGPSSKPNLPPITISQKENNAGSLLSSPSSLSPSVVVSETAVDVPKITTPPPQVTTPPPQVTTPPLQVTTPPPQVTIPPPKVTTPTSRGADFSQNKVDSVFDSADQSLSTSSSNNSANTNVSDNAISPNIHENLSVSSKGNKTILSCATDSLVTHLSHSQKELNENKANIDIKSMMSPFQITSPSSSKFDTTSSDTTENLLVKNKDPDALPIVSSKEEYKSKRQTRSKTLPAAVDEQKSPKVQRSSSHHIQNSGTSFPEQPVQLSEEIATLSLTSTTSAPASTSDAKKPEQVKFSSTNSTLTSAGEPSWMSKVRKRKEEQEIQLENEKTKVIEAAVSRPGVTMSEPKSVFTSASYLEKKRGSVETVSVKHRELPDRAFKKTDSDVKRQSVDVNSQNKQSSTDVRSTKRDSTEIEISQLGGSVKASRSLFDSVPKSVSQKDSVLPTSSTAPVNAERIKPHYGSSSAITASSSGSVKTGSNIGQEPAGTIPGAVDNAKSIITPSGFTHTRGGSVKTSEVKSTLYTRSGSIKASAHGSSLPSEAELTSVSSKTGTSSAFKPDHLGASLAQAPTSLSSSAPHVSMHVAAQPNTSLPSQTSSAVTATTDKVTSTVASNEKKAAEVKKTSTTAKVPAWRTHLSTSKDVKIEIIENSPSAAPPPAQTSSEILRKGPDKNKLLEATKKTEGSLSSETAGETETSRRSSKVLDMVKNFQNLQAPS